MGKIILDKELYQKTARQMAAEGCVLLKNEDGALPLCSGDRVAVFGRCAFHYYKSGLGSGGLVNTSYVVGILDALNACKDICVNQELMQIYEAWIQEHPIDRGKGWGSVPWSQKEMPLTEQMEEIAGKSDVSIVIIGRTAGEDQDNNAKEGSYLLTSVEKEMIAKVSRACKRTVVLLNVGNIIDMKWVKESNPAAVMYVWQGGQEGGNGVVDVLTGAVNPCGKLTDTIAQDISDYPSTKNFGNEDKNYYAEDIFVGYRYFETFAIDKVLYPFGAGLSYTSFSIEGTLEKVAAQELTVSVRVKNTGTLSGKEIVFLFVKQPQGILGKPEKTLIGFAKTKELLPGEEIELLIDSRFSYFASYDEEGRTGNQSAFVLEAGEYELFVGKNIRETSPCGSWHQEYLLLEQAEQACAPRDPFLRMIRKEGENGKAQEAWEPAVLGFGVSKARIESLRKRDLPLGAAFRTECELKMAATICQGSGAGVTPPFTEDGMDTLADVFDGRIGLTEFVSQLSDEELICIFRGEGMCSRKVTPGTASAFGGVTETLRKKKIPLACCADGPSGIRMDCGTKAFSVPNGTAIGCSFHLELAEALYEIVGCELRKNKVDTLLGPGMNIHRNPLNGRNFEYFSEDPLLSGKMAAAQVRGLEKAGVTGTIKHFCANNQEQKRTMVDAVVSERALREIYLRGFEIAVKEGGARSIMSSYNPVNGIWAAGNYELLTIILREEWGYDGIVMTDWWANANWEGEPSDRSNRAPMVLAQNDLFMVCPDALEEMEKDNVRQMLQEGVLTRGDLQRNAENILNFLLKSPAMLREMGQEEEVVLLHYEDEQEDDAWIGERECCQADEKTGVLAVEKLPVEGAAGKTVLYEITMYQDAMYQIELEVCSEAGELAQLPVSVYIDNLYRATVSIQGTNGTIVQIAESVGPVVGRMHFLKLVFGADGMKLTAIRLVPTDEPLMLH